MSTMSDRLFSTYDEKTKAWGQIYENDNAEGRALLRRRTAYYKARQELTEYVHSLERTVTEIEGKNNELKEEMAEMQRMAYERGVQSGMSRAVSRPGAGDMGG